MARFTTGSAPYGVVEMNHATWPRDGRVPSQLPLSDQFTKAAPCENGMWLVYDEVAGQVRKPTADTEAVAIVYSSEKDYGMPLQGGLGYFKQVEGEYPRLGRPVLGDKYTTNTFDLGTFADEAAIKAALATGVYLVPATTGVPTLTATPGTAATVAKVIKVYTVPSGAPGIKVEFTKVVS